MSDMFLSQEEVDAICAPLKQGAAQYRRLQELGIRSFLSRKRRAQVPRLAYELWKNPPPAPTPAPAPWYENLPLPRPWHETPLGKWQALQRAEREAEEAERVAWEAAQPKPTKKELREARQRAEVREREHRAALSRHHTAKRRAARLQRTPTWADFNAIRAIYVEARRLTIETGIPHHVDHEIPMQGRLVSGLHVHNNLQILTATENIRKRNRFEIDA